MGTTNLDTLNVTSLEISGTAQTIVNGVAAGYKVARGTAVATDNVAVATGLASIVGYAVSAVADTATKADAAGVITAAASGATLTVYRWKHTAPSTATLIAATTAGTISWVAVGT